MTKKILVTRPNYDKNTSYLHYFCEGIINTIKTTHHIHATDLAGPNATRANFENAVKKEQPQLIFLNGHGDRDTVMGHRDEVILDQTNINLTKEKIVYALSCDSLENLGKYAVDNDTKAYIGYRAKFMIVCDPARGCTPHTDKNAHPFKIACFTLINSLISGLTTQKSIELTKREYESLITSYGTSEDDPYGDVPLIRFALTWDLEFLDMCGDTAAYF